MHVYIIQHNTSVFSIALLQKLGVHTWPCDSAMDGAEQLSVQDLLKVCRVHSERLSEGSNSCSPCYITEDLCHGWLWHEHTNVIQVMTVSWTKSCATYRFFISRTVSAKWAEPPSVISKRKPMIYVPLCLPVRLQWETGNIQHIWIT